MAVKDIVRAITGAGDSDSDSKVDNKLVAELEKKYQAARNARLPFERQWYVNLAFYFGRQYVVWSNQGLAGRFIEPLAPSYRVRLVANKCKSVIGTEVAKLLKEKPRGYVVPSTSDDIDKAAARAAGKLYEALEQPQALDINAVKELAVWWTSMLGNGFTKQSYDKDKEDFTGKIGSLVYESFSPFNIYCADILEPEIENQEWIIQVAAKPVDWVNNTYGVDLQPDSATSMNSSGSQIDPRFVLAMGITQTIFQQNYVTVKEIWIKPCPEYPKGLMALWSQGTLLHKVDDKWVYKHKQYPFTKYNRIQTGRFYSDSILVDFIPLQKEYNKSISQLLEIRNAMSKPQWVMQRGSVDVNQMTNQPGLLIQYQPGALPPQVVSPPPIPSYVGDLVNRIQSDMNDTSGQHEITKGSTPVGVTAATAISYLQEEDDSKLSTTVTSIERGTQKTASQLLSIFAEFVPTDRMIKIVGDSDEFEVTAFQGSTLNGNTDYRVEPGSAMPISRAARQALILELNERGLPMDQTLRYMGMSETQSLFEDSQRDNRQATKENLVMAGYNDKNKLKPGVTMPINDYDNHIVHITTHGDFAKTEQFDTLKLEEKQAFLDHILLHKAQVASMYGRSDLVPKPIIDPATGDPVRGPDGKPNLPPTSPLLDGFVESVKLHGPPPPPPPPQIGGGVLPGAGNPFAPQEPNGSSAPGGVN